MRSDAVFPIASTTKQFTAAAVMQLVEAGKLSLDDPISRFVPSAPAAWSGITLRHLLTHESGISDYTKVSGFLRKQGVYHHEPDELLQIVEQQALDSTPGTRFSYDNTGYVLLGFVIERASNQSYSEYLRQHIFLPLGMLNTALDGDADVVPKSAFGYSINSGVAKIAPRLAPSVTFSAGGLRSTADDLLKWDQALYTPRVLTRQSISSMFSDYGHGYGFGSFIEERHGHRLWDHGGDLPGFSAAFDRFPDDHLTVIVLSNEGDDAEGLAGRLADAFFDWRGKD